MNEALEALRLAIEEEFDLDLVIFTLQFNEVTCEAILSKHFLVIEHEGDFYLSFKITSATPLDICKYTMFFVLLLQEKVIPYNEFFYETEDKMIYFGEEAFRRSKELINKHMGLKQCPLCEKHLPVETFSKESDYCVVCNKITLPKATFH